MHYIAILLHKFLVTVFCIVLYMYYMDKLFNSTTPQWVCNALSPHCYGYSNVEGHWFTQRMAMYVEDSNHYSSKEYVS